MRASDPVGFFDSGIGGVTVLKEAQRLLPNENYVFFQRFQKQPLWR